jgi:hypothetical protein
MHSYSWGECYVDGICSHLIADAFSYGFPDPKPARHGAFVYIRIHNKHRPDHLVIRSYPRVERYGDRYFASEYPRGPKTEHDFSWHAVRNDGRVVAHDARFRLPRRGDHAYMEFRPRWDWHGTAPLQFAVRFAD